MKSSFVTTATRGSKHLLGALVLSTLAGPVFGATDIPLWYSLQGFNAEVFKDLVSSYNSSQADVKVVLRSFKTPEALNMALDKAAQENKLPAIAQIGNTHTLDNISQRKYIQPFYNLQKNSAFKGTDWFVAKDNAFVYNAQGNLMAFPFMLEIPVMYYNLNAFKTAKLDPAKPERVWMGLQSQLVKLANNGSRLCPLTSNLPVSINLENLAAVNNQFYASAENGLQAKGLPSFSFNSTYVRHLSLMISWVRSEIMTQPDVGMHAISRFGNNECAVLMSDSGYIGRFNKSKGLDYAISGLPYYPEVTKNPGNPFVTGSALWVMKSSKEQTAATVEFLAWLAQPKVATKWYQNTGYLPLTKAAFEQTPASYYKKLGSWQDLVAVYSQASAVTGRGFRINNYPAIRSKFTQILDTALSGQQPAVTALNLAASEGNMLVKQKE